MYNSAFNFIWRRRKVNDISSYCCFSQEGIRKSEGEGFRLIAFRHCWRWNKGPSNVWKLFCSLLLMQNSNIMMYIVWLNILYIFGLEMGYYTLRNVKTNIGMYHRLRKTRPTQVPGKGIYHILVLTNSITCFMVYVHWTNNIYYVSIRESVILKKCRYSPSWWCQSELETYLLCSVGLFEISWGII